MSKNKSLRRIDKEYDKPLKYPDINDYLTDTSYSKIGTGYHDNLIDTQLVYRMQDNEPSTQNIQVAGSSLSARVNAFVLYGYYPDLESVREIRLSITAFGTPSSPYSISLSNSRTSSNRWATVLQFLIPNLGVNKAVNYGIYLADRTVQSIYSRVFNALYSDPVTRPRVVRRYITNDLYDYDDTERNRLFTFVKENLYTLTIPLRVEFFHENDEDDSPSTSFSTNFNMRPLLTYLRSTLRVASLDIKPTSVALPAQYRQGNYFEITARIQNSIKLLPKYRFNTVDDFEFGEQINLTDLDNDESRMNTVITHHPFASRPHQVLAHTGYNISYPPIYYSYNWKFIDNTDVYLNSNVQVATPIRITPGSTKSLTIKSYYFGHNPTVAPNRPDLNPFRVYITFTVSDPNSSVRDYVQKFQLRLFNNADSVSIVPAPNNYALMAGSLDAVNSVNNVKIYPSGTEVRERINATAVTRYRVLTTSPDTSKCRMFSCVTPDPTNVYDSVEFFNKQQGEYTASIEYNAESDDYTLILEWANRSDTFVKYFWPFAHFRGIQLSLCDFFQRPLYQGVLLKNVQDCYPISENPFRLFELKRSGSNVSQFWSVKARQLTVDSRNPVNSKFTFNPANDAGLLQQVDFLANRRVFSLNGSNEKINISYVLSLYCRGFESLNPNGFTKNHIFFVHEAVFVTGTPKRPSGIAYRLFNINDFIKKLTIANKVTESLKIDFKKSSVSQVLLRSNLLKLATRGSSTNLGTLILIPPLESNGDNFTFTTLNNKLQNRVIFVISR